MLTDDRYTEIWQDSEWQSLSGIFCRCTPTYPEEDPENFTYNDRKEIFFWVLKRLLVEGRLKLAKDGKFLEGTPDEQVELFKKSFPESDETLEDELWFFLEKCPGIAVWVNEDGSLEWT